MLKVFIDRYLSSLPEGETALSSADLIRKIEIHIETTEECIENFAIPPYVKELLQQDIELYNLILKSATASLK